MILLYIHFCGLTMHSCPSVVNANRLSYNIGDDGCPNLHKNYHDDVYTLHIRPAPEPRISQKYVIYVRRSHYSVCRGGKPHAESIRHWLRCEKYEHRFAWLLHASFIRYSNTTPNTRAKKTFDGLLFSVHNYLLWHNNISLEL